jgi:ATP:ADP antiporter, AAA family
VASHRARFEIALVAWSAAMFGLVLATYTAFHPVRDALMRDGAPGSIPWLFTATFVAVVVVSPLWSALLARRDRRRVVGRIAL